MDQLTTYYYYPLGSRQLRLTYPTQKGTDIWLLERWLNRVPHLRPGWATAPLPEEGILTGRVLLQIRQLAKYLLVWQPEQIGEITYQLFGHEASLQHPGSRSFGSRPLLVGDEGSDVWVLQNRLVGSNRRFALILGHPADGHYDQRTARLVRAFQRESLPLHLGVRATGQAFTDTLLAVWDRTLLGARTLATGSRGLDVLALQELLTGFGHPLPLTGIFDRVTAAALSNWQQANSLPITGEFAAADCWRMGLARGY